MTAVPNNKAGAATFVPGIHPARLSLPELLAECSIERTRRSGPGGQHRNKVETAVVVTHLPTGLRAEASERRSQHENQVRAVFRLRVELALKVRSSDAYAPSVLWTSRTAAGRLSIRSSHDDFPALLAECLDALATRDWAPAAAGHALGVTGSQLVRLLKHEPEALAFVNAERRQLGLSACR